MKLFGRSEKKETENYEKKYLARYKKQQKAKPKKTSKNKKDVEIESDEKNQVEVKIQKKEPESLSTKFESVKQEYNITIKNLMDAKKVLNGIKEDIQTEEYKKQNLLTEEISNSKRELSEIKDEIKKYNSELESVRTNADNSPDFKKMREEKEKLENEIIQKRKDLDSGFRELKFIKDEMVKSSKSEGTDKIVDAASAVVASMNQKLQTTLTELNAVKKALENEREHQKKSGKLD